MRTPTIKSQKFFSDEIREQTLDLGEIEKFYMARGGWRDDEKSYHKFIFRIEKLIRSSYEYKKYMKFLKDEIDMNQCAFFSGVSRDNARIEIHHAPLTLFDITSIVLNEMSSFDVNVTAFEVAERVMKEHFSGNIGLIPVSKTIHDLIHCGEIFVPVQNVFGNVKEFYFKYERYFTDEQRDLLRAIIERSRRIDIDNYKPEVLEKTYTYIKVDGYTFPQYIESPLIEEKKNA